MRAALLQISSTDDPAENLTTVTAMLQEAKAGGAGFALTPEVTNCVSQSRDHQRAVLHRQDSDPTLAGLRNAAARLGLWVLAGSLAVKSEPPEERFANRSFLIAPNGDIHAWYDKLHMFDVQVTETETFRESAGFAPGNRAVVAATPFGKIGMAVCYDLRFPCLFRDLAQAGATILTVPAAFSPATGAMHWEPLLRARAIENGAYVLAPAQTGKHTIRSGKPRTTHGHSLAVSPWGEVLVDAGTAPGISFVDLDQDIVQDSRGKVPSLQHDRTYSPPDA